MNLFDFWTDGGEMLDRIKASLRPIKRVAERALHGEVISRETIARQYLAGNGIEIGALHCPLKVPAKAKVRYVDRMPVEQLRSHYPELSTLPLVPLDIIDDGEKLSTLPDAGEDFVIANHFLEHCQDPIGTIDNVLRVLKPGGIFFLAVPDKRGTFDILRPLTPLQHHIDDHEQGPAASKQEHYREWARSVKGLEGDAAEAEAQRLLQTDYSIHFNVWDLASFLGFLVEAKKRLSFDIELCVSSQIEIITILQKPGGEREKYRARVARDMLASCRT